MPETVGVLQNKQNPREDTNPKDQVEAPQNLERKPPSNIQEKMDKLKNPTAAPRGGMIPFALLSRKGNRTKLDKIQLPETSSVVVKTRQRISEEKAARNEIKEQTMQ